MIETVTKPTEVKTDDPIVKIRKIHGGEDPDIGACKYSRPHLR
jgi:hypothetical protein